MHIKLN